MSSSKKKKADYVKDDPDYKPFIVMNECLQVWVGLRYGGRQLAYSDDFDEAKILHFHPQFKTLKRLTLDKLEQIYV